MDEIIARYQFVNMLDGTLSADTVPSPKRYYPLNVRFRVED